MIVLHFLLSFSYSSSYAFHYFNDLFWNFLGHSAKWSFLPLNMWEGQALYSLQISSARTPKSTFILEMLTASPLLYAYLKSMTSSHVASIRERQGPREVFIWESSRDQKIPKMYSLIRGSDPCANNPLWKSPPVSPFWTSRDLANGVSERGCCLGHPCNREISP